MTVSEVVNKLALELAFKTLDFDDLKVYKEYLNMALIVGIEHFTKYNEEIIAMDFEGVEYGRFNGIQDAGRKLSLDPAAICNVLSGRRHSHGGYLFIRSKDKILVKREENTLPITK